MSSGFHRYGDHSRQPPYYPVLLPASVFSGLEGHRIRLGSPIRIPGKSIKRNVLNPILRYKGSATVLAFNVVGTFSNSACSSPLDRSFAPTPPRWCIGSTCARLLSAKFLTTCLEWASYADSQQDCANAIVQESRRAHPERIPSLPAYAYCMAKRICQAGRNQHTCPASSKAWIRALKICHVNDGVHCLISAQGSVLHSAQDCVCQPRAAADFPWRFHTA